MESCFLAFFTNILVVLYSIGQQDLGTATTARSRGQLPRSCQWNCHGLWYQLRDPCIHWSLGHSHCSRGTRVDGIIGITTVSTTTVRVLRPLLLLEPLGSAALSLSPLCRSCSSSPSFATSMKSNPPTSDVQRSVCCALQRNLCWMSQWL